MCTCQLEEIHGILGWGGPPLWNLHLRFRWIPRDTLVQYLGCIIGIDFGI